MAYSSKGAPSNGVVVPPVGKAMDRHGGALLL